MNAYSENQLNESLESIEKLPSDFYRCMLKNWVKCKRIAGVRMNKRTFSPSLTLQRIESKLTIECLSFTNKALRLLAQI